MSQNNNYVQLPYYTDLFASVSEFSREWEGKPCAIWQVTVRVLGNSRFIDFFFEPKNEDDVTVLHLTAGTTTRRFDPNEYPTAKAYQDALVAFLKSARYVTP